MQIRTVVFGKTVFAYIPAFAFKITRSGIEKYQFYAGEQVLAALEQLLAVFPTASIIFQRSKPDRFYGRNELE